MNKWVDLHIEKRKATKIKVASGAGGRVQRRRRARAEPAARRRSPARNNAPITLAEPLMFLVPPEHLGLT